MRARVEKLRKVSSVVIDQAAYDPSLRFLLVAAVFVLVNFLVDLTYQRSFIEDQDIRPDERFLVNVSLKYLGSYSYATSANNVFGASGSDTND